MDPIKVRLIEELAANAWRPAVEQSLDGWRMRFNQGVNRRGNSVWPNALTGSLGLEERLEIVEAWYARWEIIPRFQICPAARPDGLAEALAARGYTPDAHTSLQVAELDQVSSFSRPDPGFSVTVLPAFNEPWMAAYKAGADLDAHTETMRRGTFTRIGPQAGFVQIDVEGQPAAVGVGIAERGWLGVFSMVTLPAFRRQGAATAVLHALAGWGRDLGANNMYLQIMENNPNAQALYQKVGFKTLYQYYYAEGRHLA